MSGGGARAEARGIAEDLAARCPKRISRTSWSSSDRALLQPVNFTDEVSIGEDDAD